MNGQCIGIVPLQCQTYHTAELTWERVSDDRDNADGPQGNQREGDAVIARNNVEIGRFVFDDVVHLRDVARSFFDGYHILEITCNAQGCFCLHVHAGTTGDIIKHNRQIRCFRNGLIMLIYTFLRWLVVIWNDG